MATSLSGEHSFLAAESGGVTLKVWAVPGAKRTEVAGIRDGHVRIRLAAQAHEGKANEELRRFLAERAGVPRSCVEIVAGQGSRRKVVRVHGADAQRLEADLCPSV